MEITIQNLTTNQFTDGLVNVVELIHWTATDGTSTIKGTTRLKPPKKVFKPFAELTEDQVIDWVLSKDSARIKKMLADTTAKSLTTFVSTPWSEHFSYEEPENVRVIRQTYQYNEAVSRLAQYVLAEGRAEVYADHPTGEYNEEGNEVMESVLVQTAIEPLDATVEQLIYADDPMVEPTLEIVPNPLIVADTEERAAAQLVIDNTPEEIK